MRLAAAYQCATLVGRTAARICARGRARRFVARCARSAFFNISSRFSINPFASSHCWDGHSSRLPSHSLPRTIYRAPFPDPDSTVRYGILARENVCTENLTPFLKLLPSYKSSSSSSSHAPSASKSSASSSTSTRTLAGLLRPRSLFASPYHSLSLRTHRVVCAASSTGVDRECNHRARWRMEISVSAVLAPASLPSLAPLAPLLASAPTASSSASSLSSSSAVPFLARASYHHRWSLSSLFGRTALRAVAASASHSRLVLELPPPLARLYSQQRAQQQAAAESARLAASATAAGANASTDAEISDRGKTAIAASEGHVSVAAKFGAAALEPCAARDASALVWDLRRELRMSGGSGAAVAVTAGAPSPAPQVLDLLFDASLPPPASACLMSQDISVASGSAAGIGATHVWCNPPSAPSTAHSSSSPLPSDASPSSADLLVERWIDSDDLQRARLHVRVRNRGARAHSLRYLDQFPWFMEFFYHTLRSAVDTVPLRHPFHSHAHAFSFDFAAAAPRRSAHRWAIALRLDAGAEFALSVDFRRAFLRVAEFPVDVARGFDIGAAMVVLLNVTTATATSLGDPTRDGDACEPHLVPSSPLHASVSSFARVYSPPLLLRMPYPDFSMPFNVIAFTSTVLAFFFGSMFTVLFRDDHTLLHPPPNKLVALVQKCRARKRTGAGQTEVAASEAAAAAVAGEEPSVSPAAGTTGTIE